MSQPIHHNQTNLANLPADRTAAIIAANTTAVTLNNQAGQASSTGNHTLAISLHNQALPLKIAGYGPDSIQAAITFNALGECHLKAGNLDQAEENLLKALRVRDNKAWGGLELGPRNDAAASRDNYAQVLEARGGRENFGRAREVRKRGAERGETMCGCYEVCFFFFFRFLFCLISG